MPRHLLSGHVVQYLSYLPIALPSDHHEMVLIELAVFAHAPGR